MVASARSDELIGRLTRLESTIKEAKKHLAAGDKGATLFVPPGRCLVLKRETAFWVTLWGKAEYAAMPEWGGAMMCSAFRNEDPAVLSSSLVLDACAATRWRWPELPELGMITIVNQRKVRPKRNPGYCFLKAGFEPAGKTKGGLVILQLKPDNFPEPRQPLSPLGLI